MSGYDPQTDIYSLNALNAEQGTEYLDYNEGDKINLPENIAKVWIQKGLAVKISKKVNKSKFETKELKVENIEIKEDATN